MDVKVVAAAAAAAAAIALAAALGAVPGGPEPVRVAFLPSVSHAIPIVGLERGAFAEAMAPLRVDALVLDSGTQAVQSLVAGSLDLAYVGPGPAVNAFVRSGGGVVILSGAANGGVSLVAREGAGISGVADLGGMRVAVPQVANSQDVSLRHHLAGAGLAPADRGGTVMVMAAAGPEIHSLLSRGMLDAAWVPEPWATLLVESLGAERVLEEADLWPGGAFASVVLVARAEYAGGRPGEVASWLGAHNATAAWIAANPGGAREAYASFASREALAALPAGVLEEAFSRVEVTTAAPEGPILEFARRAAALGYLDAPPAATDGIFYGAAGGAGG